MSTFNVAYEVITLTDYTEEAIIGVDLPSNARAHMMLIVSGHRHAGHRRDRRRPRHQPDLSPHSPCRAGRSYCRACRNSPTLPVGPSRMPTDSEVPSIASIALVIFGLTFVTAGIRAAIGPTLTRSPSHWMSAPSIMSVAVDAADTGSTRLVPVLAVMAIVGFTANVAASRFIEYEERAT